MNIKIKPLFEKVVDLVFGIILLFIILAIAIGAIQLFVDVWDLLSLKGITGQYINMITDVLTLYVMVELSRSLIEYFETHKLRLTFIIDAAIVFIVRELLIGLFKHEMKPDMIYAISTILFVLGALRIAAIVVYQREKQMSEDALN
ncbi:phosphate-starvation-inducible PsiE family protein [Paraglaciecola aquimarina]|uniref:Phosphate-starvation-inducible PsiE family protein n=1 Tax=Paraglaciecola algarum TaxID=3050085 RepID=A0ABS9D9Z4_9ALTE|nr:phosphate-starvation-inducible PsiE family protein [Paraglaciecola sp. G1-23]MCF2949202.1 phosphate-starvation-inducible PsiE family protein [Paraglaciecola sp. G1-23]